MSFWYYPSTFVFLCLNNHTNKWLCIFPNVEWLYFALSVIIRASPMSGNIILHYFNGQILSHMWMYITYLTIFCLLRRNSWNRIDESKNVYILCFECMSTFLLGKFVPIYMSVYTELKYWFNYILADFGWHIFLLFAIIISKKGIIFIVLVNLKN